MTEANVGPLSDCTSSCELLDVGKGALISFNDS